jgi:DNA-binding winged helix-turn-helix (wHTH) protein
MTMNMRSKPSRRRINALPNGTSWSRRATPARADLEFGRFRVLLRRRQLLADGVPVELGMRAFDILMVLVEADGGLVTKGELLSRVWPGVIVSEENVKLQVSTLRKAFGPDRDLIITEFGRGYRFTGAVRTNTILEPCWPMRSQPRSAPTCLGRGLPSCRHLLQCSVNPISCTHRSGFRGLDPMRR